MKYNFIVSEFSIYDENLEYFFLTSKSVKKNFINRRCYFPDELISDEETLEKQTKFILEKYKYYKTLLKNKLNVIHEKNLSDEFWTKAFNLYLIRLIMAQWIRFNKFRNFNPDQHIVHVLNENLYYCPLDTPDSIVNLLNSNFYQEQIFSIYIKIFHPNIKANIINYNFDILKGLINDKKYDFSKLKFTNITIIDTHIDKNEQYHLSDDVKHFYLPHLDISDFAYNNKIREKLDFEDSLCIDNFDRYFLKSLKYLLPRSYIEAFDYIYNTYNQIDFSEAKYILCENWLANDKLSIFLAIAKEKGVLHFALEHGHTHYLKNNYASFAQNMVDKYVSYGWQDSQIENLISAGMWRLNPEKKYTQDKDKKNILFVCYGNTYLYDTDFMACHHINNSAQDDYYKNMQIIFKNISLEFIKQISYKEYPRYRGREYSVSQEYAKIFENCIILENKRELGYGNLEYINTCKLVLVGNIGTVFFETLYHGAPTISFYSKKFSFIDEQYLNIFQELEDVGILHTCPYKMAQHICETMENPYVWWNTERVVSARTKFMDLYSSPNKEFYKFLDRLSLKVVH